MPNEEDLLSPIDSGDNKLGKDGYDEVEVDLGLKEACEILLEKEPTVENYYDFTVKGKLVHFINVWDEDFKRTVGKDGNILHRLISEGREGAIDRLNHLSDAIMLIVEAHPYLLWHNQPNRTDTTPLWLAVKQKEANMVLAFMEGLKRSRNSSSEKMQEALTQRVDSQWRTMLHCAIEDNLAEEAIQALLAHASDATLAAADIHGHTALHLAVNYGDCTNDRVKTIKQMLRVAHDALSIVDKSGHSIFAYHSMTKSQWLEKNVAKKTIEMQQNEGLGKVSSAVDSASDARATMTKGQQERDVDPKAANKAKQSQSFKSDLKSDALRNSHDTQKEGRPGNKRDLDARGVERIGMFNRDPRLPNIRDSSVEGDASEYNTGQIPKPNQGSRREHPSEPMPGITRVLSAKPKTEAEQRAKSQLEQDEQRRHEAEQRAKDGFAMRRFRIDRKRAQAQYLEQKRRDEQDKVNTRERAKRRPEILKQNSETVMLEIKLRCMRTLSPKNTSKILYGKNPEDRQICFDFIGRPSVLLETFKMSFNNVKFDKVLQYVAFPSFKLGTNSEEVLSRKDGLGRKDMVKIFQWLRQKKDVERIIKVIVNDYDKPSHSDAAILDCLRGFQVEDLQWLKADLDPVTILGTSDEIRKLRLRWSGSNTALRAWSDPYGLRQLRYLETVYLELVGDEVLENYNDTEDNIRKFEARLNMPHDSKIDENVMRDTSVLGVKRITVKPDGMDTFGRSAIGAAASGIDISHTHIENHKWLETMDNFREEMVPVWREASKQAEKDPAKEWLAKPVVVALIDDGVDLLDPSLQGKLWGGKTLSYDIDDKNEPTEQREHACWESSGGHGTVMANLIYRVCPMVKLYVIRMETHADGESKGRIVARSAAEAVHAAVDAGVQIISMSWTIGQNEQSEASGLTEAIMRAYKAEILMFASSSDTGYFSEASWPVAIYRDAFFRIGAAKADGKPYDSAGPVSELNYTFPGVDVVKAQSKGLQRSDHKYEQKLAKMGTETGSSVATALAAGTAAMVLTLIRIAAIEETQSSRRVTRHVLSEMQKRDNMAAALDRLGNKLGENKFIEVWKTLDTRRWPDFREKRPDGKMKMVADKIVSMLPSQVYGK